jgi:hypothetical protein
MATFTFPTSPRINETHTVGIRTYRWTGYAWAIYTGTVSISGNVITNGNTTITGNAITVGDTTITGTGITTGNLTITGSISLPNLFGNAMTLGTNTAGVLVSNAVTLASTDSVTNSIAKLNQALSYLQPPFVPRGTDPNDWNQNLTLGLYSVKRATWAGTTGTPTEAYSTGLLSVLTSDDIYVQKYQPNDTTSLVGAEYVRTRVGSGAWTAWARVVSDYGRVDGGTF